MHAFFFLFLSSSFFFFLLPLSSSTLRLDASSYSLGSLLFAPLRCISFLLVWYRLASPRLCYWSASLLFSSLGYDYLCFASLLLFSSISYSIPLYSILFHFTVLLFRQRHRLPHSALQRLSTTHLLTGRGTDTHTHTDR